MPSKSQSHQPSGLFGKWNKNRLKVIDFSSNKYAKFIAFTIKPDASAPFASIAASLQSFFRETLKHPNDKVWHAFNWAKLKKASRNYTMMDNGTKYKREDTVCFGDRECRV